jgi:hypothetical protein
MRMIRAWARQSGVDMPLLRYFVFVGGALLVLLFICDAVLPQVPLPGNLTSGSDLPAVRIRSDRKWPERVVFDTNVPTAQMSVARVELADPAPATIAEASTKARARDAFAQLPAGQAEPKQAGAKVAAMVPGEANKVELKLPPKRKVAKARSVPRPVMLVAQQPHVGLFDATW